MSQPPGGLAFAAVSLGLLFVLIAGALQIGVLNSDDGSGPGDGAVLALFAIQALGAAGAFLFALGVLIALWGACASRGEPEPEVRGPGGS